MYRGLKYRLLTPESIMMCRVKGGSFVNSTKTIRRGGDADDEADV